MNYHLSGVLTACIAVLACGGPARSRTDMQAAQAVTFCAPARDSVSPPTGRPVDFPDTLRIVGDARERAGRRPELDTIHAFVKSRAWYWENEPLTFGSTSYYVWGPTVVAHGSTNAEEGFLVVKYETYDGIPLYAPAEQMPEPRLLYAPEGLPCRLQPYTHEENRV